MHINNTKLNILFLGDDDFIDSFKEIKDNFNFDFIFSKSFTEQIDKQNFEVIIIDEDIIKDNNILKKIDHIKDVSVLLIKNLGSSKDSSHDEFIEKPLSINELNKKITQLASSKKFNKNSSILIKEYVLDKNEKKLKKGNLSLVITEKEIQLLELLFFEKKAISKKMVLKKIWKYSSEADTHTVETHIYRLRKKIFEKFNDDKLIKSIKEGYLID
jgi:DNA-binding response OmpR family regulator|tara:strand:- start:715 stop:1359 length:645 start_codon:yes stop_codon:yes gene_type:complete